MASQRGEGWHRTPGGRVLLMGCGNVGDVRTPVNAALTALVQEVEAGTRPIRPDNLAGVLR